LNPPTVSLISQPKPADALEAPMPMRHSLKKSLSPSVKSPPPPPPPPVDAPKRKGPIQKLIQKKPKAIPKAPTASHINGVKQISQFLLKFWAKL
jgi:hypothetical protein